MCGGPCEKGVQVSGVSERREDESDRIPCLVDGEQYKFLGVLGSIAQEDKLILEYAAKEYLRRLSVIWTSPLSDYNRVVASNQFALPVLGYLMWKQQWPVMELKQIDMEARKIVVESGGRVDIHVAQMHCCTCQEVEEDGDCAPSKWSTKPRKSRVRSGSMVTKTPH